MANKQIQNKINLYYTFYSLLADDYITLLHYFFILIDKDFVNKIMLLLYDFILHLFYLSEESYRHIVSKVKFHVKTNVNTNKPLMVQKLSRIHVKLTPSTK